MGVRGPTLGHLIYILKSVPYYTLYHCQSNKSRRISTIRASINVEKVLNMSKPFIILHRSQCIMEMNTVSEN